MTYVVVDRCMYLSVTSHKPITSNQVLLTLKSALSENFGWQLAPLVFLMAEVNSRDHHDVCSCVEFKQHINRVVDANRSGSWPASLLQVTTSLNIAPSCLGFFACRSTPLSCGYSLAELLMSRQLRSSARTRVECDFSI